MRNPYRWLPDTDESDVLDKKPGAAEPRRALLKSDVSVSVSRFHFLFIYLTTFIVIIIVC